MQNYVLGLDLGETSIGWALIASENGNPSSIIDTGVRVFPPGAEVDEKKGTAKTGTQDRRAARGARRVTERRGKRKSNLKTMLIQAGVLPSDNNELNALWAENPYRIRAEALDDRVPLAHLGRAFYQMSKHRGFKSNRKSQTDKKEAGKVDSGIKNLQKEMDNSGARTLGEYLYGLERKFSAAAFFEKEAIRNRQGRYERHPSRKMYEDEFEMLWSTQKQHYPDNLTDELKQEVFDAIFFQRSYELTQERIDFLSANFPQANALRAPQLGRCPLFPEERRASAGLWVAQNFRLLKEVNNLRIQDAYGHSRPLEKHERETILEKLHSQKSLAFDQMCKLIKLEPGMRFNLEMGKRKELKGNEIEHKIMTAFDKKRWLTLDELERNEIRGAILESETEEEAREVLSKWNLSEKSLESLLNITPPDGYLAYSEKALHILAPLMEDGLDEYGALQLAREKGFIPHSHLAEVCEKLPKPPEDITNPVVKRALTETRRVVNRLIDEYGKPDRIVIELARELKNGAKKRKEIVDEMRENEERNNAARRWYAERGIDNPSREDIIKYKLWQDQKYLCAYTGEAISEAMLLSDEGIVEVDHILPYSRSLDNSYSNRVLCFAQPNREKGNRTPYEWLGPEGNPDYDKMLQNISRMDKLSHGHKARFSQKELDIGTAISRRLVDTQYISRAAVSYLECLYPPELRTGQQTVYTNKGGATAELRHLWGLNPILGEPDDAKERGDHRHHAIDACVIACTDRKHMKQLADSTQRGYHHRKVEPPWPSFRDDVAFMVRDRPRTWTVKGREFETQGLIVSHRVDRKIRGALHKETYYGPTSEKGVYVHRVALESLTWPMIKAIRDEGIKKIILQRCSEFGCTPENGCKLPPDVFRKPLAMPSGVPIRKVRVTEPISQPVFFNDKEGNTYRAAYSGNNHHVEIIEETGIKGTKTLARVVSMYELVRNVRAEKKPLVDRASLKENQKFIMSFCKRDSAVLFKDNKAHVCFVQSISGKDDYHTGIDIYFRLNTDACEVSKTKEFARVKSTGKLQKLKTFKVTVDHIGRISAAND